jgi:UDP-glucose 4-epimerase
MTVTPADNGPCWLLTGGAGYIGAHIVRAFGEHGLRVVVLDDLSAGIRDNVPADVPFVEARLQDEDAVRSTIREHRVTGLLQLAAKKAVGESVENPVLYWDENVGGFARLLDVCTQEGVERYLFSSSAAVFGNPPVEFVTEETPTAPMSPYGETKLVGEWMLRDLATSDPQVRWAALRYFNVAGTATPELAAASRSSSATTTPPATGPASATTSTWSTWPTPTPPPRRGSTRARWARSSTSAAARVSPSRRSSTPSAR